MINELNQLSAGFPQFIKDIELMISSGQKWYLGAHLPKEMTASINNSLNGVMSFVVSFMQQSFIGMIAVLGQFINFILIPIIAYFLLREKNSLVVGMSKIIPQNHKVFFIEIVGKTYKILKGYVEGQIIICSLIGIISGLILWVIGVKFALVLGLISAVTQLIPVVGPLIGAVPAVIIAFMISPMAAIKVIIFYSVLQIVGGNILAPKILGDKLDLHPLTIVLGVLILGNLIGVWGVFFAAPIIAVLKVIFVQLQKP